MFYNLITSKESSSFFSLNWIWLEGKSFKFKFYEENILLKRWRQWLYDDGDDGYDDDEVRHIKRKNCILLLLRTK